MLEQSVIPDPIWQADPAALLEAEAKAIHSQLEERAQEALQI
jgi:hypothetical protein